MWIVNNLDSSEKTLRGRVIKAGFWIIGGDGVGQLIRLGSNLILTRLLVPEMFGMMAVVTALMIGLALFSDIGLRENIIQSKQGDDPRFLNIIWSIQVIRGGVIWLVAAALAGGIHLAGGMGWLPEKTVLLLCLEML